jgi:tetratricopeptide (TPR) repeat protein
MQGEPTAPPAQTAADDALAKPRSARFAPRYLRARRQAKRFYLMAKGALRSSLNLAGWLVGFGFLVLIYQEITTERTVIQAISVPKSFADSGLTPEVAARRLQDSMSDLLLEATSSGSGRMPISVGMDLPEIVVPTVGISLTTLATFVRNFLSLPSRRVISGELVEYEKKAHLVLRLNASEIYRSSDPVPLDRLDELWSAAAEAALRRISPYHVALSLYDTKPEQAVDIANYLIRYYPAADENVAWAHIILGIRARDYLRYTNAKSEFNEALAVAEKSRWWLFRWMPSSVSLPRSPSYASVAQFHLGSTLLDQGEFQAAIDALRQASSMDRTDPGARFYFGVARMGLESNTDTAPDFDEAERLLRKAIHDYDRQSSAGARGEATLHRSLGNALMQRDQPDAQSEFQLARRLNPGDQRARTAHCGLLYENQKRGRELGVFNENYDECVSWLRQSTADAYSPTLLADYLVTRGRRAEAIQALREAVKRDNDRPQLHAKLGGLYADTNEWHAAIEELSKAIKLAREAATLHNDLGDAYFRKRDFQQAERAYAAAIGLNRHNAIYHVNRGAALQAQGSTPAAELEYREASRLAARSDTEFNNVGNTFYNKGDNKDDFERAVAAYRKAIELEPTIATFHANLAGALRKLKQFDVAVARYEKAIALEPKNADHRNRLGHVFYEKEDFTKAEEAYRKATEIEPTHGTSHAHLAGALQKLKKFDVAVTTYEKAIELEPWNASHHNQLGNFFYSKEDFAKAEEAYRKATDIEPANAQFHANLAGALRKRNQLDLAAMEYEKSIKLEPRNAERHNELGNFFYASDDFAKARDAYRNAIDIEPTNAQLYANLAGALGRLKQIDAAINEYKRAIELKPGNAAYLDGLAGLLYNKNDFPGAADAVRKASRIAPGNDLYHAHLALALRRLQQFDEAVQRYQRAIELKPGNAAYFNELGHALFEKGSFAEAADAYQKAVDIAPNETSYQDNLAAALREREATQREPTPER